MKGAPTIRDKHWFGPCDNSKSGMMFHFREKETEAREIFCWRFPLPHSSCCTPFHLRWLSSLPWGHHYYLGLILSLHSSPYLGMFPLSLFQILRLPGLSWLQSSLTPPKQNGCYWFISYAFWCSPLTVIFPPLSLHCCAAAQERCWKLPAVGSATSWRRSAPSPLSQSVGTAYFPSVSSLNPCRSFLSQLFSTLTEALFEECFSLATCDQCFAGHTRTLLTQIHLFEILGSCLYDFIQYEPSFLLLNCSECFAFICLFHYLPNQEGNTRIPG